LAAVLFGSIDVPQGIMVGVLENGAS